MSEIGKTKTVPEQLVECYDEYRKTVPMDWGQRWGPRSLKNQKAYKDYKKGLQGGTSDLTKLVTMIDTLYRKCKETPPKYVQLKNGVVTATDSAAMRENPSSISSSSSGTIDGPGLLESGVRSKRGKREVLELKNLKNRDISFLTRILGRMTPICFSPFFFLT